MQIKFFKSSSGKSLKTLEKEVNKFIAQDGEHVRHVIEMTSSQNIKGEFIIFLVYEGLNEKPHIPILPDLFEEEDREKDWEEDWDNDADDDADDDFGFDFTEN